MTDNVGVGISQLKWQSFAAKDQVLMDMEDYDAASRGAWGSFQLLFKTQRDGQKVERNRFVWHRLLQWIKPKKQ